MSDKPASETTALWAFLLVLAAIACLTLAHGCSVIKTPYGESWNFLYDSSVRVRVTLPDGTVVEVDREVNPNTVTIRELGKGIAEGAVRGAIGGER